MEDFSPNCDLQQMMEITKDWIDLINHFTPKNLLKDIFPSNSGYYVINDDKIKLLFDDKHPNATEICWLLITMLLESQVALPCPKKSFW